MKIWITGASGMLGTELASKLSSHDLLLTGRSDLDISNENAVPKFLQTKLSQDTVIKQRGFYKRGCLRNRKRSRLDGQRMGM